MKRLFLAAVLVLGFLIIESSANTYNLELNSSFSSDSYLSSYEYNSNFGTLSYMLSGIYGYSAERKYRTVGSFSMPNRTGTIDEIILSLYCVDSYDYAYTQTRNQSLHNLLSNFSETQVTWNKKNSSDNWISGGGDFNASSISYNVITGDCGSSPRYYNWTILGDNAVINYSLSFGDSFNFMLKSSSEAFSNFATDAFQSQTGANSPKIFIKYSTNGTLPILVSVLSNVTLCEVGSIIDFEIDIQNQTWPLDKAYMLCGRVGFPTSICNITPAKNGTNSLLLLNTSTPGNYSFTFYVNDSLGQLSDIITTYVTIFAYPQGIYITPYVTVGLNLSNSNSSVIMLSSNSTRGVYINLPNNYTDTTIWANVSSWADLKGYTYVEIFINKTDNENKSRPFHINLTTTDGSSNKTLQLETRIKPYPTAIFNNFSTTPGKLNSSEPYATWIGSSSGMCHPAANMRDSAICFLASGSTSHFSIARSGLMAAMSGNDVSRAIDLRAKVMVYDWLKPYLNDSDDILIRANLARHTDRVWSDLNTYSGSNWLQPSDYEIYAYSSVSIAGMILSDYYNQTLPYGSTSDNWISTINDLFVSDTRHPGVGTLPLVRYQWDEAGHEDTGSYRNYYDYLLFELVQVYNSQYPTSIFNDYPILKGFFLQPLEISYPDRFQPSYTAGGTYKYYLSREVLSALDSTNRSYLQWYYSNLYSVPSSMQYAYPAETSINYLNYLTFAGYDAKEPEWTSKFNPLSWYQTFRTSWDKNASYMLLNTYNITSFEWRPVCQNDILSIDYYAKGDSILIDSGECKYRDTGYGDAMGSIGHNVLRISDDNPLVVYDLDKGVCGAGAMTIYSHPYTTAFLTNDNIDFYDAGVKWLVGESAHTFTNPTTWGRVGLSPNKEYFVLLDKVDNSIQREMDLNFRLGSFNITRFSSVNWLSGFTLNSTYTSNTKIFSLSGIINSFEIRISRMGVASITGSGNISVYLNGNYIMDFDPRQPTLYGGDNDYKQFYLRGINLSYLLSGNNTIVFNTTSTDLYAPIANVVPQILGMPDSRLQVEDNEVLWKNMTYGLEYTLTTSGHKVYWNTSSVYKHSLSTLLYTAPEAIISTKKYMMRQGGYANEYNELDSPVLYIKRNQTTSLYSITLLQTSFQTDIPWEVYEIPVIGGYGTAIRIDNGSWTDRISFSNGSAVTFDGMETDSLYSVSRNMSGMDFLFVKNSSYYTYSGVDYIKSNKTLDYLLLDIIENNCSILAYSQGVVNSTIYSFCNDSTTVERNDILLAKSLDWDCFDESHVWINMQFNSIANFSIMTGGSPTTSTTSTSTSTTTTTLAPGVTTTSTSTTTTLAPGGSDNQQIVESTTTTTLSNKEEVETLDDFFSNLPIGLEWIIFTVIVFIVIYPFINKKLKK